LSVARGQGFPPCSRFRSPFVALGNAECSYGRIHRRSSELFADRKSANNLFRFCPFESHIIQKINKKSAYALFLFMLRGRDSVTVAKPRSFATLNHSLSAPTRPRPCTSCTWLRLSHPDARRAGVLLPLRSHQKTPQRVFFLLARGRGRCSNQCD